MKKVFLKNHVMLVGVKRFDGVNRLIDYYIEQPGTPRIYAFTKTFTNHTYDLCKSGVRINDLITKRSKRNNYKLIVFAVFLAFVVFVRGSCFLKKILKTC